MLSQELDSRDRSGINMQHHSKTVIFVILKEKEGEESKKNGWQHEAGARSRPVYRTAKVAYWRDRKGPPNLKGPIISN